MSERNSGLEFFAGFLVGALAGAAAALMMAPQAGSETRTLIRDRGLELRERADGLSVEARRRAEVLQEQAKERADALGSQIRQAVAEGKTVAAKRKEELFSKVNEPTSTAEEVPLD